MRQVDAARRRPKALGRLDLELARNLAPAAVMRTYNNRYFFSDRVDPRGLRYNRVYQDWSIPALALRLASGAALGLSVGSHVRLGLGPLVDGRTRSEIRAVRRAAAPEAARRPRECAR
jgi:hypothetical protein